MKPFRRTLPFFVAAALATSGLRAADAPGRPVSLQGISHADFDKLPPSATVEFQGRSMPKSQFLAEMQSKGKSTPAVGPKRDFAAYRAAFLDSEKRRIQVENASLRVEEKPPGPSIMAPTPTPCSEPQLTGFGGHPPFEPGEELVLKGCGFGTGGTVTMAGNFPKGALDLEITFWGPTRIHARVPAVTGVQDQLVTLQVVPWSLKLSNKIATSFRASRDVVELKPEDVTVVCRERPGDSCAKGSSDHTTVGARHVCCYFDTWIDMVTVNVQNGWWIEDVDLSYGSALFIDIGTRSATLIGFDKGKARNELRVVWQYWTPNASGGGLHYDLSIMAKGIAGTSYK